MPVSRKKPRHSTVALPSSLPYRSPYPSPPGIPRPSPPLPSSYSAQSLLVYTPKGSPLLSHRPLPKHRLSQGLGKSSPLLGTSLKTEEHLSLIDDWIDKPLPPKPLRTRRISTESNWTQLEEIIDNYLQRPYTPDTCQPSAQRPALQPHRRHTQSSWSAGKSIDSQYRSSSAAPNLPSRQEYHLKTPPLSFSRPSIAADMMVVSPQPQRLSQSTLLQGKTHHTRFKALSSGPQEELPFPDESKRRSHWERPLRKSPRDRSEEFAAQYRLTLPLRPEPPPDFWRMPFEDSLIYKAQPVSSTVTNVADTVPSTAALQSTAYDAPDFEAYASNSSFSSTADEQKFFVSRNNTPNLKRTSSISPLSMPNRAARHAVESVYDDEKGISIANLPSEPIDVDSGTVKDIGSRDARGLPSKLLPSDVGVREDRNETDDIRDLVATVTPSEALFTSAPRRSNPSKSRPRKEEHSPAIPLTPYQLMGPKAWKSNANMSRVASKRSIPARTTNDSTDLRPTNTSSKQSNRKSFLSNLVYKSKEEKREKRRQELKKSIVVIRPIDA